MYTDDENNRLTTVLKLINDLAADDTGEWERGIAYLGFAPEEFRAELLSMAERVGISNDQHYRDVRDLCHLYLQRGTSTAKMKKRTNSDFWTNRIEPLIARYQIKGNVVGASNTVTLGRIANAHPEIIGMLCARGVGRFTSLESPLPIYLRFPGAASLIPKKEVNMCQEHRKLCIEIDGIINPTKRTDAARLQSYWEAAHNSSMFNDDMRDKMLQKFHDLHLQALSVKRAAKRPSDSGSSSIATPDKKRLRMD